MFKRWFTRHWLLAIVVSMLTGGYAHAADTVPSEVAAQGSRILVVMTNHARYPSRSDTTGHWFTELTRRSMPDRDAP